MVEDILPRNFPKQASTCRPGPSAAEVKEGEAGKASNFDRRVWLPRQGQDEKHIGIRGRDREGGRGIIY